MSDAPKLRCTDVQLDTIAGSDPSPLARAAAAELLSRRAGDRHDSRTAQQLKKLRWHAELIIAKLEALEARYRAEGLPPIDSDRMDDSEEALVQAVRR